MKFDDAVEAAEIIQLAGLLLRQVERAKERAQKPHEVTRGQGRSGRTTRLALVEPVGVTAVLEPAVLTDLAGTSTQLR